MNNNIECKIYNLEGVIYIIPFDKVDEFECTPYYEREKVFNLNMLEDGGVLEEVEINIEEYDNLISGW